MKLKENVIESVCWASESIHNASLIHDDVVDEAVIRRNRPTLNTKISNSKAVLAGDYLLASLIAELVRLDQFAILKTLAETLEEIIEGEFLQESLKSKVTISKAELKNVSTKKTGALIAWNCHSVAILAELSENSQDLCRQIGLKLGMAFQMIDDNLDYSAQSGKEFAKDLKEGLINFTTLNLIEIFPEIYYSVYQIKGTQFKEVPWTEEQIKLAINKTSKDADLIFSEIFSMLLELCTTNNISTSSFEYQELSNFLISLQRRKT